MWIIRKRIQLAPAKALFLFVGKLLPQTRYVIHIYYVLLTDIIRPHRSTR